MAKLLQNAGCYDFVNSGETTLASGTPVLNGSLFGCVIRETKPGEKGAIQVDGIWEFPVTSSTTANLGAIAYWDAENSKVIASAGSGDTNKQIGFFTKAVVSTDTTCQVMIG